VRGPSPSCSPQGHPSSLGGNHGPMICSQPIQQNGPAMTMGPYNPAHLHHPNLHPLQHPGGPPPNHMQPPHGRHTPYFGQPDYRIYEMNKRLQQRTEVLIH
jgi:hypothetical protein